MTELGKSLIDEGIQKGIEKGREKGMSNKLINELTELPIAEIEEIRMSMDL